MKALRRSAALAMLLTGAWVLLRAPSAFAFNGTYVPGAGINGTVHDLGTPHNGMNYTAQPPDPQRRICIFCHAPHNTYRLSTAGVGTGPQANAAFDYLPLWNHTLPATVTEYIMYDPGPGAPQSGHAATQALNEMIPGSVSLLCLSCHDGSIAVNSWGNPFQPLSSQSSGTKFMAAAYQIGATGNLTNHHPIGFNYLVVQGGDTEIRSPYTARLTSNTFVIDHLYGENLECGSCHAVHNKGNTGEKLLWRSDQNSELCLTCHDKGIYTPPPA